MPQKAVFLTAGAAGMYCGSCMHDNALAKALCASGVDCLLQPVYTPIRTDGESIASEEVFFGGIHIYLLQQMPWLKVIPRPMRRMLDWPPLIRFATRRTHTASVRQMGQLTLSMLQGTSGKQAEEVARLADWLADEIQPDAVILSNLLIGGALPELRKRLPNTRLVVLLQGDDIFLDYLEDKDRAAAIELCQGLVPSVDRFVTYSRFYANKMGELLAIDHDKFVVTPLSIDLSPFSSTEAETERSAEHSDRFRLGYFARIAPEKGLDRLVDAFVQMAPQHPELDLHVAGWMSESNQGYLDEQTQKVTGAGLMDRFHYHGSPSLEGKVDFLRKLDLLSVPTSYQEPKGLFVLEAMAAGVAVVQPDHGEFGELIESTGGGIVYPPDNLNALCESIEQLKQDHQRRSSLAQTGQRNVRDKHSIEAAADAMKQILFGEGIVADRSADRSVFHPH
ncbi:MAG: glycosyltransferase family 4 protein [Planctomycetota bacterium]